MIRFIIIFFLSFFAYQSFSQDFLKNFLNDDYDSTYYDELENLLTVKIFSARKFSDFELNDNLLDKTINYRSNPSSSVGLGVSYKWLNVNLGIGLKNPSDSIYGITNRIDLQAQINLRKLTLNFYSGRYRGFYLQNTNDILTNENNGEYYYREDIQNMTFGVSSYYVFNSSRYSNRATFLQNEWQKKSAGSFIAGGNLFYNSVQADSSIIPSNIIIDTIFNGVKFDRTGYFALGGNIGYATTLVLWEHWFFNFTILAGLSSGITTVYPENESRISAYRLGATILNSFGIGYNSKRFYAGLTYSNMVANSPLPIENTGMGFNVGKVNFLFAYRFKIKRKSNNILPEWMPLKL